MSFVGYKYLLWDNDSKEVIKVDELQLGILEFLNEHNSDVSDDVYTNLYSSLESQGYAETDINLAIQSLDADHSGYLQILLPLDAQDRGGINVNNCSYWLTAAGKEYAERLRQ